MFLEQVSWVHADRSHSSFMPWAPDYTFCPFGTQGRNDCWFEMLTLRTLVSVRCPPQAGCPWVVWGP